MKDKKKTIKALNKKSLEECAEEANREQRIIATKQSCLSCGREMRQVKDPIAKKYTGHLWRCKCMPKNWVVSIG